ncbi:MAG TPA: alpha-glucuronidase [Coriobacteriia bacterium]|nr:alpha-glucuronidase [Coriobacteriia bacterium]
MTYFDETDACWLGLDRLDTLGRMTFSLLGAADNALTGHPILATVAQEIGTLVGLHDGVLVTDTRSGVDVILATETTLANLPVNVAAPHAELLAIGAQASQQLTAEGFAVVHHHGATLVTAIAERGLLYGYFYLLRHAAAEDVADMVDGVTVENPANPIRMVNQWDNMTVGDAMGSVERGYSGGSIFYADGQVVRDKSRITDYARLLASVGINALSINNVNVHGAESHLITDLLGDVAEIAQILRGYGIRVFVSANFAAPIELGGLLTADPLDADVAEWWQLVTADIYRTIPDFGGFVVKADSENRPGPFTYGRNHADGANLLARALKPHGGVVFWRCFVYDCAQDWRDRRTDRARAAYDHFMPLDGQFDDNVVLQIKNGPMDFQVREPVSPLIGGLRDTNIAVEFQIAQEYTGQQRHVCYLVPQWRQVLDFDMRGDGTATVATIASGRANDRPVSGVCAVSSIGDDSNWTGHKLAQANLFGFGRLAWDPFLTSEAILDEWIAATFGSDPSVAEVVRAVMLDSWLTYEQYTAPLGVGWMVTPGSHYGPSIDGYEYSAWGTYHFADRDGIGVDRTVATGTGYAGLYGSPWAEQFESVSTCSDELLLFFHHVPYAHVLRSGETVIQHIYDTHFAGVERVEEMVRQWAGLSGAVEAGLLDDCAYRNVSERLTEQLRSAREWRDQVNTYFFRKSGVTDIRGRRIY